MDGRANAVAWANAMVPRRPAVYTEGDQRFSCLHRPGEVPFVADCSASTTDYFCWAGVDRDPNGYDPPYPGYGYTGTLLATGQRLPGPGLAVAGDVLVVGPGTGYHAMFVVRGGSDPLCVSFGDSRGPTLVYASQDVRWPHTYLRFDMSAKVSVGPAGPPIPPPAPGSPAAKAAKAGAVRPPGTPPILEPGKKNPRAWVKYHCQVLNAAGVGPRQVPALARYGRLQQNRAIRWKRDHQLADDAIWGQASWESAGVR